MPLDGGCGFIKFLILVFVSLAAASMFAACEKNRLRTEPGIDLSERFSLINAGAPDNFQRHLEVIRKGERKDALKLVAPVAIRASLEGATGKQVLKFWGAPVFDTGDGFLMMVFHRKSGVRYLAGNKYFDPARKAEDRSWVPFAIPLDDIRQGDQLEIEVSAGPQGELTADWLALSSVRLTSGELRN